MIKLEEIKKSKNFLMELGRLRKYSEENLVLKNKKTKKKLCDAFIGAYAAASELNRIGFTKLKKIYDVINDASAKIISFYPESVLNKDMMERCSSCINDEISYDNLNMGIRILKTYETLAPLLETARKYKVAKDLTEILEDKKC